MLGEYCYKAYGLPVHHSEKKHPMAFRWWGGGGGGRGEQQDGRRMILVCELCVCAYILGRSRGKHTLWYQSKLIA